MQSPEFKPQSYQIKKKKERERERVGCGSFAGILEEGRRRCSYASEVAKLVV
jgi:hypothetical protein